MYRTQFLFNRLVLTLAVVLACSFQIGCADLQGALSQASSWRNHAQIVQTNIEQQRDELIAVRETIPDGTSHAFDLDAAISQANTKIQMLMSTIVQADLIIAEATQPTDSITRAANAISPWIPAPAQGPVVLGAALIATLFRSRNLKINAKSIIQSIEHITRHDQDFEQLFKKHADTIRTIQTPGARRMIDSTARRSLR